MTVMHHHEQDHEQKLEDALRAAFAAHDATSDAPDAAPDALSARLNQVVADSRLAQAARQRRRHTVRRGLAVASVAGALAGTAAVLPRVLVWRVLAQMEQAEEQTRSMHSTTWLLDADGTRRKIDESWFDRGRHRNQSPRSTMIYSGGKTFIYEPRARLATWRRAPDGPFANKSSGFSLRAMMKDSAMWGWHDKITLSPDVQVVDGRAARVATIEPAHEKIRIVLYAEPKTLLPFRFDLLEPTRTGWRLARTGTSEYNVPLAASLFEPKFPPGTRIVEAGGGAGRAQWTRSLQQVKATLSEAMLDDSGKEQRAVGTRPIQIRDVQMNERGDIFVLYTAGPERDSDPGEPIMLDVEKPHLALLVDGEGRLPQVDTRDARPSEGFASDAPSPSLPRQMKGARVDGQPLQWAVWTRPDALPAAQSQRPQRVTVWVDHRVTRWDAGPRAKGPHRGASQAQFTIARATIGLVPDYVRFFPDDIRFREIDLLIRTDEARADYWGRDAQGRRDWLQKSLALTRAVIERTEQDWREDGQSGAQPDKWLDVADLCLDLRRLDEAEDALRHAEDDSRAYGNASNRIEQVKQRLARGG